MEEGAVGHKVPDADALAAAVVDLHVLYDNAIDGGLVAVAVFLREGAVVTGSCSPREKNEKKNNKSIKNRL